MRLNTKKYQELMAEQELTPEIICRSTGLGSRSFQWIMTNGFASEDAMERLAEVAGAQVGELLLPDISGTTENAIEFIKHSKRATVTFSQPRYINRIKELVVLRMLPVRKLYRRPKEREQGFTWSDTETTSNRAKRNEYHLNKKNSSCMNTTSHRSNMTGSGQTSKYIVARVRKKGQVF